nr:uncharacterized protein LOC106692921 isoform X3 [Halyomorpha halys]
MAKHEKHVGNKQQDDWNELLKVMQRPSRTNSKCQIVATSYDSLSNTNYDSKHGNQDSKNSNFDSKHSNYREDSKHSSYRDDNKHNRSRDKKSDDALCVTKLRRIFASCCTESNLVTRVNELEFKIRRLERIYCRKVKKQLEEISGKKKSDKKSTESLNKNSGSDRKKSSGDSHRNKSPGSSSESVSPRRSGSHKKTSGASQRRSSGSQRRGDSTSVNRVVFKRDSGNKLSEEAFSDDSSAHCRKENYFFITTTPGYFDKDQIPVRDVACSSQDSEMIKKYPRNSKNSLDNGGTQKHSRSSKNSFDTEEVKTSNRSFKNSFDKEEVKKSNRSMKNSFDKEEKQKLSSRSLKNLHANEEVEKSSGNLNNAFVEYMSILKQTKEQNSVAANIATFNNASKATNQQGNVSTGPVAQPVKEICHNKKKEMKEGAKNKIIKSPSFDKAADSVIAVGKIHRSVSTCKLPIDISLYLFPKLSKIDSDIKWHNGAIWNIGNKNRLRSNSHSGVSRAVCFDTPSSCTSSQMSVRFSKSFHRCSCSNY